MIQLIILTKAEADAIRGRSSAFAAIEPVALKDGTYMIGSEVLADAAHTQRVKLVANLDKKPMVTDADIAALKVDAVVTQAEAVAAEKT